MNAPDLINQLVPFREQIYASFTQRSASLMDLLDALCANTGAKSVVELSLNPLFRREYGALYAAIGALATSRDAVLISDLPTGCPPPPCFPEAWSKAIAGVVPAPKRRNYWLFGVDVTPLSLSLQHSGESSDCYTGSGQSSLLSLTGGDVD